MDRITGTGCLMMLVFLCVGMGSVVQGDEIDQLVTQVGPPRRYEGHAPNFTAREVGGTYHYASGPQTRKYWFVMDGDRHVAIYDPGMMEFDLITQDPAQAPVDLVMPARYHWARHLGARVNLCMWYDGFYVSSNEKSYEFVGGGATIQLKTHEKWTSKRDAVCDRVLTLRLDPVLGYTADIAVDFKTKDASKPKVEFTNFLTGGLASSWPDLHRYDRLVYSPTDKSGYCSWYNNLAAAEYSDESSTGVRPGGFIGAMPDANGWGVAVGRSGNCTFSRATCNVWIDQHNYIHLPATKAASGYYEMAPTYRLAFLPPEVVKAVVAASETWYTGRKQVMVRVGQLEDFEAQPLPLTTPGGMMWSPDLSVATGVAHSGSKSFVVDAVASLGTFTGFFQSPQLLLLENSTYVLECWVKVEGAAKAYLSADYYEWSPHTAERTQRNKSTEVTGSEWQKVTMVLETPDWDPFADLRFIAEGTGKAYFDDFHLRRESGATEQRRELRGAWREPAIGRATTVLRVTSGTGRAKGEGALLVNPLGQCAAPVPRSGPGIFVVRQ